MRWNWLSWAAWLASSSWLGCSEGHERPGAILATASNNAADRWCSSMCSNYRRCQGSVSATCVADCQRGNAGWLARTSEASLEFQIPCMNQSSCPADYANLLSGCYDDGLSALEPSEEAGALCDELAPTFFVCHWFPSRESCARFHASFSAPALASERACAGSQCTELDACIEKYLYGYGEW